MNSKVVLTAAIVLLSCGPTFAVSDSNGTGLFLEPGLTYQMTDANVNYSSGLGSSNITTKGFGLVAKAGVHVYDRFFVAVDARYSILKYNDNARGFSEMAPAWDISPVIGIQMPDMGPRFFASYIVTGTLDPKASQGSDPMLEQATGFRVGAGLKLNQFSVNIEWQTIRYGKAEIQNSAGGANTTYDYKSDGLVASLTFPIDFN